jgi:hypothetical protein
VIITGPPGAGKTTVAAAPGRGQRAVHLHSDDFYGYIRSGYMAPYRAAAHEQNRVVIGALAGAAFGYGPGGYLVMLDGIADPWFLDPFRAWRDAPLHYVALRPERPRHGAATGAAGDPAPGAGPRRPRECASPGRSRHFHDL